jgi:acyl-CoA synthetase (AMP-forming)/AMP-acid ligase II
MPHEILDSRNSKKPATLVELLQMRAAEIPDQLVFIYLSDGEEDELHITYHQLDRQARAIGAWLQEHSQVGDRALLLYPPGLDYIAAYFGCLYAGVVAVPAYPPRLNRPTPRIQGIVADCAANIALTTTEIYENLERRFEQTPDLQAIQWLDSQKLDPGLENIWREPDISSNSLAFLQYTSGSTSQPKGVMVSHANLIHNLGQIYRCFQLDDFHFPDERGIIWLPSYHDMGLIGGILEPVYSGSTSVLLPPLAFLQRPVRWLQAISRHNGAISGGPNFAYDICVEKVKPEQIESLNLSQWRLAFCGAEPIRRETLERFAATFAPSGFKAQAFYPCYGLAEATLIVSGGVGPGNPVIFKAQRAALEQAQVVAASPQDDNAVEMIGCGATIQGQQIAIVDTETLRRCPADQIGEIWVAGPSVAQGYWNRPDDSKDTFGAYLADTGEGPFMRTGDLGFLLDGQLFITGRLKDLIIIRGSNHYPQDIELTVEKSHPALQPSSGAAFAVQVDGLEELVVVQEVTRQARNSDMSEVVRAIRSAIAENHDLQVFGVVLIRPLSIPKTSSGKIQRRATRAAYLDGSLEVIESWRLRQ